MIDIYDANTAYKGNIGNGNAPFFQAWQWCAASAIWKMAAEGGYNMLTLTFAVEGGERGHYGGHFGGQTVLAAANGTRLVIGEKLPASKMSVNPGNYIFIMFYMVMTLGS